MVNTKNEKSRSITTWKQWENHVKQYYIKVERYDWVDATDKLKGIESIFHWNRSWVITKLLRKNWKGHPIIDIGCGTGLILRKLPSGAIGFDINPWAVAKAKEHAPHAQLVVGDVENIPFRDRTFPMAICTEVLEHVPNPKIALNEIKRILSHSGRLIGSVPHNTIFWRFRILSSTCPHSEPFHNQYNVDEVRMLLHLFIIKYLKLSILRLNIVFIVEKSKGGKER